MKGSLEPKRRRLWISVVAICLLPPPCATLVGGWAWPLDLIASVAGQLALGTMLFAATMTVLRKWDHVIVAAVALGLHAVPWDSPRAERAHGHERSAVTSCLQFNVGGFDRQPRRLVKALVEHDVDVIVLIEGGRRMLEAIRRSPTLTQRYPGTAWPRPQDPRGWCVVLSRWPTRPPDDVATQDPAHVPVAWAADLRVVDHPDHPFLLAVAHPPASRDPWRWRDGNRLVRDLVERIEAVRGRLGLPMIVAADLNATPASWRSVHLCRAAGLARGIPRWTLSGTYPRAWPAPLRLPIDDFWVDQGVRLVDWRTVGETGSDHQAVRVDLVLPADEGGPRDPATAPG